MNLTLRNFLGTKMKFKLFSFICVILMNIKVDCQQIYTDIKSQPASFQIANGDLISIFVLSQMPKITMEVEIIQEQTIEVKTTSNMKVVKLQLFLQLKDLFGEKYIANKNFAFTGSGKTEEQAYQNAFNNLKKNTSTIRTYLEKTNNDVENPDCNLVKAKIDELINSNSEKKALHLSRQYNHFCKSMEDIYEYTFDKIQTLNCEKYLLNSKAYSAGKEYDKAVREIMFISPNTPCFEKAQHELDQISKAFDSDTNELYSLYKEIGNDKSRYMEFFLTQLFNIQF